jgi:preprotein translocase subunit SecG
MPTLTAPNLMNLLKYFAIFAIFYFGITIVLRVILDRLYRNIQKRYVAKENKRFNKTNATKEKARV